MNTEASPATTDAPELDILQQIAVTAPCTACGQHYQVTLREVLLAQEMLHAGCSARDETECLPLTYAALADEPAVRDFERSLGAPHAPSKGDRVRNDDLSPDFEPLRGRM